MRITAAVIFLLAMTALAGCDKKGEDAPTRDNVIYFNSTTKAIIMTMGIIERTDRNGTLFTEIYLATGEGSDKWDADLYCSEALYGKTVDLVVPPKVDRYFISYSISCGRTRDMPNLYYGGMDNESPDDIRYSMEYIRSGKMKMTPKKNGEYEIIFDVITHDGNKAGLYYSGPLQRLVDLS